MAYDPNEPRDKDGKWTSGGAGGGSDKESSDAGKGKASSYKKKVLSGIAKEHLDLDTLETRKSDSLDFHDLHVDNVKKSLVAAYEAGRNDVVNTGKGEHEKVIGNIAKDELDLDTLQTRNSDSHDFHEHSVWGISSALDKAYEAGRQSSSGGAASGGGSKPTPAGGGSVAKEEMNYKAIDPKPTVFKGGAQRPPTTKPRGSVDQEEANYKPVRGRNSASSSVGNPTSPESRAAKAGGTVKQREWHELKPGDKVYMGNDFHEVFDAYSIGQNTVMVKLNVKTPLGYNVESHRVRTGSSKATTLELSRSDSPYFLRSVSMRLSREQRPGDQPINIEGVPCYYKSREAVRCGNYVDGRGKHVEITPKMLDHLCYQFQRMKDAGVKVPLPTKHPKPGDNLTDLNRGYIYGMKREGDSLKVNMQLIGDDALRTAARSELSIGVSSFNAAGTRFENAIDHVALVVDPVVTGLGNLEPAFAASRDAAEDGHVSEFVFSASHKPISGDDDMSLSENAQAAVIGILGDDTPDDLTAETAITALANHVGGLQEQLNLSRSADDFTRLEIELKTANDKLAELGRQQDPDQLRGWFELSAGRIDNAVQAGDMPKFVGEAIKKDLGTNEKPSSFMLSRTVELGDKRPVEYILSLFKGSKLGASSDGRSKTGIQLSRSVPGDEGEPGKIEDNELVKIGKALHK